MEEHLLRRYIRQQPDLWRSLLEGKGAFSLPRRFEGRDRIVLLGSGSSHYAALMARPVLERALGVEVSCPVPSERGRILAAKAPLYLAISQSGASANTCAWVRDLRAEWHEVLALTERADSPVGRAASGTVLLPLGGERIGPKTKGVSATVLVLMLLGLSLCRDAAYRDGLYAAMDRLAALAPGNLDRAEEWCWEIREAVLPFRHLYVLSCEDGIGAAREGALKLLETNDLPCSAYPLDEYVHGIQNALDGRACLICLLPPEGPGRARMETLISFARSVGAQCFPIASGGPEFPGALRLEDPGAEELRCLTYLPALQTLAAELSEARGIDTSRRRYPDFYSRLGSKLE